MLVVEKRNANHLNRKIRGQKVVMYVLAELVDHVGDGENVDEAVRVGLPKARRARQIMLIKGGEAHGGTPFHLELLPHLFIS
jgi:hypothetical protein